MTPWPRVLLVGALAGLGALALLLVANELMGDRLIAEIGAYLRKRDDFRRYLEEREHGDDATTDTT